MGDLGFVGGDKVFFGFGDWSEGRLAQFSVIGVRVGLIWSQWQRRMAEPGF